VFRRRKWFQGRAIHGSEVSDIAWFNPDGKEMTDEQWQVGYAKAIGIFLNGKELATPNARGERIVDDSFLLFFNAYWETLDFVIPPRFQSLPWIAVLDTAEPKFVESQGRIYAKGKAVPVTARSIVILKCLK
jgi:glycogen operon protein